MSMNDESAASTNGAQWTIIKLIRWATSYLNSHDVDSPRATGEILLAHALHLDRIDLYLRFDQPLEAAELRTFKALIKRRIAREPVAYIVGKKEFWSLDFDVNEDVLIPRPETECLVEAALDHLAEITSRRPRRILDLGTGSGAIAVALASQKPHHIYFASDRFQSAVELARRNAGRHDLCRSIHFLVGDWLSSFKGIGDGFDMIVSNPPYIPSDGINVLQPEIYRYEPIAALDGNEDGLACYRRIIKSAHIHLNPDGVLLLEIGHDQREDVQQIVSRVGRYQDFNCAKDYSGYDRVVWMRKRD